MTEDIVVPKTPAAPALTSARAVPLSFAAIIVCFFFTFVTISCQGTRVAGITGMQLVTGTQLSSKDMMGSDEKRKLDSEPRAMLALLAAASGDDAAPEDEDRRRPSPAGTGNVRGSVRAGVLPRTGAVRRSGGAELPAEEARGVDRPDDGKPDTRNMAFLHRDGIMQLFRV
jgi:hypothetical protein